MASRQKIKIMIIEDEEFDVQRIERTLQPVEDRIIIKDVVSNGLMALKKLEENPKMFDVVIMDFQIAGGLMGEQLIRKIKQIDPLLQVLVVTKMTLNITDYEFANQLLEAGATWYCTKYPGDIEEYIYQPTDFILNILNAYEKKKLEEEKIRSTNKLDRNIQDILTNKRIIGESDLMKQLNNQITVSAQSDANIMIYGSSGTGKELVATNIHYLSKRRLENFVPINCGSLPDNLIESELFGFEKGSFTGADTQKAGLFELADQGTIFLDEISELPLSTQSTLLRVIQEGEIDKIGRQKKVNVNVRIIAATNRDLKKLVKKGEFREDLYYRLNVIPIYVPTLSERQSDIALLIKHFMHTFSVDMNRTPPEIEEPAMTLLTQYQWPGNVRELQNVVQRLLLRREKKITVEQVEMALGMARDFNSNEDNLVSLPNRHEILSWKEFEHAVRKKYFQFVRRNSASDAEAARLLGLAPPNYYRMCKELGLK